ncbi:MAG: rhamnulokinase family protein [Victivallales bacterium]
MNIQDYLIFDLGASSGRAIICSYNGGKLDFKEIHRFENTPVEAAGTLYWDVLKLYNGVTAGLQKACRDSRNIVSAGIDTWGVDGGFIDKAGKLIANPVNYRDIRRNSVAEEVLDRISSKEIFDLTGRHPYSISTMFLFYALVKDKSTEIDNAAKFLMMPDLINYFLTGETFIEYTNAATTCLLNQSLNTWENKVFSTLELPINIMPELICPGEKIGNIRREVRDTLQVPEIPVIAPATHDTASAVAGVPAVGRNKKWAFVSMGTWGVFGIETPQPVINEKIFKSGLSNAATVDGRNFIAAYFPGLFVAQQCLLKWRKDSGRHISWEETVSECLKAPAFSCFINAADAAFASVVPDMPGAVSQFCAKTGQKVPQTQSAVARCCYESLAMRVKTAMIKLEKVSGEKFDVIHLVGGACNNIMLCQWIANATGIPVIAGPVEATAIGNLLMQMKGLGEISSVAEGRRIIADSFELSRFEPADCAVWDEAYQKYCQITGD